MDLKKYLDKIEAGKFMDPRLVKSYLYQINEAILFCHQRRVLHRDLKPQNLLITKDGVIKVQNAPLCIILIVLFTSSHFRLPILDWGVHLVFR